MITGPARVIRDVRRIDNVQSSGTKAIKLGKLMTNCQTICAAVISIVISSLGHAQEKSADAQLQRPIMSVDFDCKPFPGGLRFSADGKTVWTDRFEARSVRDGQPVDSSQFNRLKTSHQIIDLVGSVAPMLIAVPQTGELLFWDQKDGLRQRVLKQTGRIVAARYLDRGQRFALVFSKPPSIYYGDVKSDENDSIVPLETEVYKSAISADGSLVAVRNEHDIDIWDVRKGVRRTTLKLEHKPFSFAFSHDGRWIATGTSHDNLVRLFDTGQGELQSELKAHTKGTIFLGTAVYSLAFSPNGRWLASGGHDGRIVVWDLGDRRPLWQAQIEGPPIVCSLAFSPDSSLLAGSFENVGPQRGIRVWTVSDSTDEDGE
jgi:WD40 repeat protein